MRLLFYLFTVFSLTSRPHARPLFEISGGLGVAGNDKMPKDLFYGMYVLKNRYSMDQVRLQNLGAKHTVEYKGKRYVYAKKKKTDFDRRFCTFNPFATNRHNLNVTVRAIQEQNQKLLIVFRGKPSPGDAGIPVSGIIAKEFSLYDSRMIVVFDKSAYVNDPQFEIWYKSWENSSDDAETEYRLIQAEGYKPLMKPYWRNRFKKDHTKLVVSPAECTDANCSAVDAEIGATLKNIIDKKINDLCEQDSSYIDRIESEGISILRLEITKWAADAWDEICQSSIIPMAFKKCGFVNDMYGRENHFRVCQNLKSFKVHSHEWVRRKKPYSPEEIAKFRGEEVKLENTAKKKALLNEN